MPKSTPSSPSSGNACNQHVGGTTATCPLQDQVVLEQIAEEVRYGGQIRRYEYLQHAPRPRNQWVNLDPSVSGGPHYDYGRVVYLKAKLKWRSGDQSRSLSGKTVYWQIEPAGSNRADLATNVKHGFDSAGSLTVRKTSTTDSDGWTPVVQVYLSNYGGDQFSVRATELDNYTSGKVAGAFTVWKKIYYTLACMLRSGGGSNYSNRVTEATLVSEYQNSFVQLEKVGALGTPAHQLLVEYDQARTWGRSNLPAEAARTMNFALIDTLAKGAPIAFTREADPPGNTFSWTLSSGSYAFDLSAQNRWLTSAQYYDKRQPAASRTMHNLANNKVTLTESGLNYRLAVDVSTIITAALPRQHIHVVLNLKKRDFLSGLSWGAITIVGMRWRERNYSGNEGNATMHTMFHESGHYLGVAPKKLPDAAQTNNPRYYDESSLGVGQGPHCSFPVNNPATSAALPANPQCIMYHEFRLTMSFCSNCSESMRARDLSSPSVSGRSAGY